MLILKANGPQEYSNITNIAQVVQEYERAVIFRIGRLLPGGAKGPGLNISLFSKYFQLKEWQFSFQTRIK